MGPMGSGSKQDLQFSVCGRISQVFSFTVAAEGSAGLTYAVSSEPPNPNGPKVYLHLQTRQL